MIIAESLQNTIHALDAGLQHIQGPAPDLNLHAMNSSYECFMPLGT